MSSLLIEVPGPNRMQPADAPLTKIAVTHLHASAVGITDTHKLLPATPGIRILLPRLQSFRLNMDTQSHVVPRGMALAVDGAMQAVATRAESGVDTERGTHSLRVIEINATLNDALPLRDLVDLPLLLETEPSEEMARLAEQLTFAEGQVVVFHTGTDISLNIIASRIVAMLLRNAEGKGRERSHRDKRLEQLRRFLHRNLSRKLTNPEIARHLGMSRTSFCRWAKETLGCPPSQYLKQLRLVRSQELIAQDAGDIESIARETGFSDRSHLSRDFKKHFGLTPVQYRKMTRTRLESDLVLSGAEHDFRHGRFEEAVAACEQCLISNPPAEIRDRARYQKGLCLRALGRGPEAIKEWRALEVSPLAHRAAVQECRQLFSISNPIPALDLLKSIYMKADSTQKRDAVSLWNHQVMALLEARCQQSLRQYLAVRKSMWPHDIRSMQLAVDVLRKLGENMEVLEHSQEIPIACYFALRRAGRLDEAIKRYGAQLPPEIRVVSMRLLGQDEAVLSMEPEIPDTRARALTRLGRAEEAIALYPRNSACAYLALKRYQELLDKFPEPAPGDDSHMRALIGLGEQKQVDQYANDPVFSAQWRMAQFYLRPESLLETKSSESSMFMPRARLLLALRALEKGNITSAETILDEIDGIRSPTFWWEDHTPTEILMVSLLKRLLGRPAELESDLEEIVGNHKYKSYQALWHDAAFLLNRISSETYLEQPMQTLITERHLLIQGARLELRGQGKHARVLYSQLSTIDRLLREDGLLMGRFVDWRLQAIQP